MEKADPTVEGYGYNQPGDPSGKPPQQHAGYPQNYPQAPPPQYGPPPGQGYGAPPGQGYGGPPPNYGQMPQGNMMTNNTVVVNAQPQASNIVIMQQIRPSSYLGLAIFVCLCINLPLGLVAIIFSVMSQSDADNGDLDSARSKGRVSMWLSIGGIIFSVLLIVFVIIYVTAVVNKAIENTTPYNPYG